jgi:hypothetical protein
MQNFAASGCNVFAEPSLEPNVESCANDLFAWDDPSGIPWGEPFAGTNRAVRREVGEG